MNDIDQLREDVRATAPEPRPQFAARLERRVETGFTLGKPPRRERRQWLAWAPAASVACALLVAAVVGAASLDGSGGGDDDAAGGAAAPAQVAEPETGSGGGGGAAAPEPLRLPKSVDEFSAGQLARPTTRSRGRGGDRVVVQRTSLALETGADDFQAVADEILRVADDANAIVQSSRVSERDGRAVARYDLRVPSSRLDETLAELTGLAHVVSRTAATQDITRAYVSATDRLEDARDQRDALLKALEKADTDEEAEAIRRQLRLARVRISFARQRTEALERRADRSRVNVTLESTGRPTDEGGAWTPGDALGDAGRILEVAAGVVVVTAAALLPVAIIGLLAALAARTVRRRRREAALDAA